MNFPFYLYPNQVLSGYTDYEEYLKETERLYNDLCEYKSKPNTIFQLIIGAVMEEAIDYKVDINNHWRQLFPFYLEYHLETNTNSNIDIFLISPNIGFKNHIKPTFINATSYYEWKYDKNTKTYYSTTENINVHIYYTPFPSIDLNNYKSLSLYDTIIDKDHLKKLIQTENDINFINNFYQELQIIFETIEKYNGFIICNSYAVFRYGSIFFEKFHSYGLFPDIKNLFKDEPTRVLAEWVFKKDNYNMIRAFDGQKINYTDSETGIIPIFKIENEKRELCFAKSEII
tara:strand:- start:21028 stop:21888 length:861 start_codon:yes stop_codon:yes gene_type:complete